VADARPAVGPLRPPHALNRAGGRQHR
jgi:hypothetical protein